MGGSTFITGDIVDNLSVTVSEGWNLIGSISEPSGIIDSGGITIPNTIYNFGCGYQRSDTLISGKGYWILSSSSGEVIMSSSAETDSFVNYMEGANELVFNNCNPLYFGITVPDSIQLSYSLPPKPLAGTFDVRYAGDLIYCGDAGAIEVMNNSDSLVISYKVTNLDDNTEWRLTTENGEYVLDSSGEISLDGNVSGLIIAKKTLSIAPDLLPRVFTLHSNHPNPFNPITTLRYDLPSDALVTLSIYDMLGREITQLVNTSQQAGFKSVQWDATDSMGKPVSAGVYLYQIQAGEFVQTKKMVLLK
jgi:hypothetical protein